MRSLAARGFSLFKLRRLSATPVNGEGKKKGKFLQLAAAEENKMTSEPHPSNARQPPSQPDEYWSTDAEIISRAPAINRFDEFYLEHRSSLLAYGKQMKRVEEKQSLPPPPVVRAQQINESRASKFQRRNSNKSSKQGSWLSRVRRSPDRAQAGSKHSRRHLLSPRS